MILVDACLLREMRQHDLLRPGKHAVTHAEPCDVAANGNDFTREFIAEHKRKFWSQDCAELPLSELEVYRVQARGAHASARISRGAIWPVPGHPSAASFQGRRSA